MQAYAAIEFMLSLMQLTSPEVHPACSAKGVYTRRRLLEHAS